MGACSTRSSVATKISNTKEQEKTYSNSGLITHKQSKIEQQTKVNQYIISNYLPSDQPDTKKVQAWLIENQSHTKIAQSLIRKTQRSRLETSIQSGSYRERSDILKEIYEPKFNLGVSYEEIQVNNDRLFRNEINKKSKLKSFRMVGKHSSNSQNINQKYNQL